MPLHIATPLIESRPMSRAAGQPVWLKLEAVQPSGSFKIRGIGVACEEHVRRGKRRFVCSSGGNAGIAVAFAGRCLQVPVVVFVPESTSEASKDLIRQEGAEIVVHGASWQEANALAVSATEAEDAFLHPFDDPLLWDGHASMIDEVAQTGVKPGVVVLSVGGGGLLAGVVAGLRRNDWGDVPIIAVETEGAASFAQSVQAGRRIELAEITTVATCLGAKQVSQRAFDLASSHPIRTSVVSDRTAVAACVRFLDDHRLLVEPACGASLSLAYDNAPELTDSAGVLMIVCGGAGATARQLQQWSEQLG